MSLPQAPLPSGQPEALAAAPARVSVGRAVRWALRQFARNWLRLVTAALVAVPAQTALGLISVRSDNQLGSFGFNVLSSVAGMVLSLPLVRMVLTIADGRQIRMAEAFAPAGAARFVVPMAVFGALTGIGLSLCVFPGAAVYALLFMTPFLVVEHGHSLEALGGSVLLARRQVLPLVGLGLFWIVATVTGVLLLAVGLLVTAPVTALASVHVYRQLTAQPITAR